MLFIIKTILSQPSLSQPSKFLILTNGYSFLLLLLLRLVPCVDLALRSSVIQTYTCAASCA